MRCVDRSGSSAVLTSATRRQHYVRSHSSGFGHHCGSSMPLLPAVPKSLRRIVIISDFQGGNRGNAKPGPGVVSRTVARGQSGTSSTTRRSELKLSGDRRPYRTAADCRSQSRPCGRRRGLHTLARRDRRTAWRQPFPDAPRISAKQVRSSGFFQRHTP